MNPSLPSSMQGDADKMKGDAIGDTMYSERWVLKTLMKLSEKYVEYTSSDDYRLESDLEGDLGLLWDMTIEPDVAKFLVEQNALDLIVDILKFSCSPRLTEIVIGILGNMACEKSVRQKIDSNEALIKVIINLLNFTDSPTLVQLVRLLTTCIWDRGKKVEEGVDEVSGSEAADSVPVASHWVKCLTEESNLVCHSINFILASSRNGDLLTATLGLLDSLFNLTVSDDDYFCRQFSTVESVNALVEALKEVTSHAEEVADSHANHRRVRDACAHWISVLHRIAYHGVGAGVLGECADSVFDSVSSVWLANQGRVDCGALHTVLAVELLAALLPLSSRPCGLGTLLDLLESASDEWDNSGDPELRTALEDLCVSVVQRWAQRGELEGELRALKAQQLSCLESVMAGRVTKVVEMGSASDSGEGMTITEIAKMIKEMQVEH